MAASRVASQAGMQLRNIRCGQSGPKISWKTLLIVSQPDDIDGGDGPMCRRWLVAHAELQEKRLASSASATPLPRPKQGAWQPPPTHVLLGCSTMRDEKLWRKCLGKIEADVASEGDQQSRGNMEACLEWVRLHGYPSTSCSLVWAACGIATCTPQGEFSRFWAAHSQSPERQCVYAVVRGRDEVVCWRYGLAAANLGAPPPLREGHEETWPEIFRPHTMTDGISLEDVMVRAA